MIAIPEFSPEVHRRTHPWTVTEYQEDAGRYFDFKAAPELIPTVLEDFAPHSQQPAVQRFYRFLEWINRPDGVLETNDCAFRPPESHGDDLFRKNLRGSGRLQFFFRKLEANGHRESVAWLNLMLHIYFATHQREENFVVFETSIHPTDYVAVGVLGSRFSLRFCAYGDSTEECWACLDRCFDGLQTVLERIERAMQVSLPDYP